MPERIPLAKAKNLGPTTAAEFEAINLYYLDELEEMGWEEVCIQWVEHFPHRLNLNAFTAVIGAIEGEDWRNVNPSAKARAKSLILQLKR